MNISISLALILEHQKNSIRNMISKFNIYYYKPNAYRKDSNSYSINHYTSRRTAALNKMSFNNNIIGTNVSKNDTTNEYFKHPINLRTSRIATRNILSNTESSADLGLLTMTINQFNECFISNETIIKVSIEIKSTFQKSVFEKESFAEQNHQYEFHMDFGLNRKLLLVLSIIYFIIDNTIINNTKSIKILHLLSKYKFINENNKAPIKIAFEIFKIIQLYCDIISKKELFQITSEHKPKVKMKFSYLTPLVLSCKNYFSRNLLPMFFEYMIKVKIKWLIVTSTTILIILLLYYKSRLLRNQYEMKTKIYHYKSTKDEYDKAREIRFTNMSTSIKHDKTNNHKGVLSKIYMLLSIYNVLFTNRHVFPLKTVLFKLTFSHLKSFPQNCNSLVNVLTFYQTNVK